ncbi:DUF922 domain-containing protein [Vibrio cholerae]|nr:DUF922 domain-containing protein [Vibrio cholerae]
MPVILYFFIYTRVSLAIDEIPKLNKSYRVYSVTGKSYEEIDQSFAQNPYTSLTRGFDAYTSYRYSLYMDGASCTINTIELNIEYVLPKLLLEYEDIHLGFDYKDYLEKLYAHEEYHCILTLKELEKIVDVAEYGRKNNTCKSSLETISVIESNLQNKHDEFDKVTMHGKYSRTVIKDEFERVEKCKITVEPIEYMPVRNNQDLSLNK